SSSGNASSRRGGRRKAQAPLRVVVDLREFRSVLPNLLPGGMQNMSSAPPPPPPVLQQGFELISCGRRLRPDAPHLHRAKEPVRLVPVHVVRQAVQPGL
ncbi:unnamed protein product, partial [Ectocarpus fasciculatus]